MARTDATTGETPFTYGPLPVTGQGWTMTMAVHLNYGEKGGGGAYRVYDATGRETPVGYGYDTRKSAPLAQFYTLCGDPTRYATYAEARKVWNASLRPTKEPTDGE